MIPFPLPAPLARLHDALERHQELNEKGFFLAEQHRRGQARAQPLLMYVRPESLRGEGAAGGAPGPRPPDWMAEVLDEPTHAAPGVAERMASYGRAGVAEYWLVLTGPDPRVEVHREPGPDGLYRLVDVYRGAAQVETDVFPGLTLRAEDLAT